jgi:CheY-like chemotaxis protein
VLTVARWRLRSASGVRIYELMKALRVLVIEDDALIAMLLSELLASMGHDVCATAASEAEAVSAATRYDPDLMIVDAGLGRGSGVSAVEEILRAGPLAHLFVSGDAERVRRRRPDAIVVRKPFREAELARAIDVALATAPPRKS